MRERFSGLGRFAPLSGVVVVILVIVGIIVSGEGPPNPDEGTREVVSYWRDHDSDHQVSAIIGTFAAVFFGWFVAVLYTALRGVDPRPRLGSTVSLLGGAVATVGVLVTVAIEFVTADLADDLSDPALEALAGLNYDFYFPIAGGFALFALGSGAAILGTRLLPGWFGWVAVALGILAMTPVGFFAVMATLLWVLAASVMLFLAQRGAPAAAAGTGTGPGAGYGPPD